MDQHFLADHVEGSPGFKPEIWYNPYGDCIEYCLVNEATVADRIDGVITIYRSAVDKRPIGFQIKGVRALMALVDASSVTVEAHERNQTVYRVKVEIAIAAAVLRSLRDPSAGRHLDRFANLLQLVPQATEGGKELEIPVSSGEPAIA